MKQNIRTAYGLAREHYAGYGVDTEKALRALARVSLSFHCWQGDDVGGFESGDGLTGGGIMATGNYPGRARTADELRMDAEKALSLIPGKHRFNLHAIYAELKGKKVDRNELEPRHFSGWIDWAKHRGIGLDFNPTFFSHPKAASGFTLSHANRAIRTFWVEHAIACRKIAAAMGRALGTPAVHNIWIPDGYKDTPADRRAPRQRLAESLDEILAAPISKKHCLDAVESKLFGIGSESYVVGSHEFYMGYAVKNDVMLCLDAGHFHPTEGLADKISSMLMWVDRLLLHVSRGVRWDSDHVVTFTDDLRDTMLEVVRGGFLDRVCIATDYFDASINRIAAWVIGVRSVQKAILYALLEPYASLKKLEASGDHSGRLALMEEAKTLPYAAVWNYFCEKNGVPSGMAWMDEARRYEREVLSRR